jgi:hypothetical protein
MAVTPLVPNARLIVHYTSDLPHALQLLVEYTTVSGVPVLQQHDLTTTPTATFVATLVGLLQPMFDTSTVFVDWTLEKYDSGAYVEIDTASIGLNGTNAASAPTRASDFTFSFFDVNEKHVKIRLLGAFLGGAGAFKFGYSVLATIYRNFIDDALNTAPAHLGAVLQGRSGGTLTRFIALVVAYNRKSRRRLGAV